MRLSCLPVSLYGAILRGDMTVRDWARLAREAGLDAMDLSILFLQDRSLDEVADMSRQIEAEDMRVAVVTTYTDFTHPDPQERRRQREKLSTDLERCRLIGAEMVRLTAGQAHPGLTRARGVALAVEGLRDGALMAQRAGILPLFENHSKPGVWEHADFSHPTEVFLEVADALSDAGIDILFDTANPAAFGEDPCPLLSRVIGRVRCVHVADTAELGALRPARIGTGVVPFTRLFGILHGYQGLISIEEASGNGVEGILQAVSFVREAWKRREVPAS
jgi:sugar phosphate isomerase/epimerase